jgi:hypothetical protein
MGEFARKTPTSPKIRNRLQSIDETSESFEIILIVRKKRSFEVASRGISGWHGGCNLQTVSSLMTRIHSDYVPQRRSARSKGRSE